MDKEKIDAITTWPQPLSIHGLRGFLGLAGYYHRFIQDYGAIAAPLTFAWSPEAAAAFDKLKTALSSAPVLQLPDFDKDFIVNCDASGSGFGAVLHLKALVWFWIIDETYVY